jgi:hypothetical protein
MKVGRTPEIAGSLFPKTACEPIENKGLRSDVLSPFLHGLISLKRLIGKGNGLIQL